MDGRSMNIIHEIIELSLVQMEEIARKGETVQIIIRIKTEGI
jgi:hypothetical protein